MTKHAWGDESSSHRASDPGAYILAAAIADMQDVDDMRATMAALRLRSSGPKLHWVAESPKRRTIIVSTIAELPIDSIVVVRKGPASDNAERRRAKCLETLSRALTDMECAELALESRGPKDDARDLAHLDRLRRGHRLQRSLKLSHPKGPADPMLWVADALCGAVSEHRNGDSSYWSVIAQKVEIREI